MKIRELPILVSVLCLLLFGVSESSIAQTVFTSTLSGSNEVPTNTTTAAYGEITATLNGTTLTVEGNFDGLEGNYSASHIHAGLAGQGGGVVFTLTATVDTDSKGGTYATADNTFSLTTDQVAMLEGRELYVNIHSEGYASGEIRGQLTPQADATFRTNLSGAFEVPAVKTMASGGLVFELNGDSLFVSGSFKDLSSAYSASHLHIGTTGTNGGVAFTLNATLETDSQSGTYLASENRFELTASQKTSLMNREFYVNVHTANNASGELRGQVTPPVKASFYASLSGTAENPSIKTAAAGAVTVELSPSDSIIVSGAFANLEGNFDASVAGGSHVHAGHAGASGGIELSLTADVAVDLKSGTYLYSDNKFLATTDQITKLMNRELYVNIHSTTHASGELRGQVLGDATAYFKTKLNGLHENPAVVTMGYGAVNLEINGTTAIMTGGFADLGSTYDASHLHEGGVTANGGVVTALTATVSQDTAGQYSVASNTYTMTEAQITALYDEGTYVNVHTAGEAGGEIRGQLLFGDNSLPDPSTLSTPADNANITISGDASTDFTATWTATTDPDGNEVTYIWEASTDVNFDAKVITSSTGSATTFTTTYAVVDSILASLDVQQGASATLYHRVVASDGSNESYSDSRAVVIERGVVTSNEETELNTPDQVRLSQNYPNPFNPSTNISFNLSEAGLTELSVYNMLGQKVRTIVNKRLSAGEYSYTFNADNLSSGIYIYRLRAAGQTITKRMTIIK